MSRSSSFASHEAAGVDGLPVVVWTAGSDGRVTFVSEPWRALSDLPLETMLGERWRRAVASGERFEDQVRVRRPDGSHRWVLLSAQRDDGRWLGSAVDVDRLVRRARVADLVLDDAPLLLSITSADGHVEDVSGGWSRWSGVARERLVERGLLQLVHPDDVETYLRAWNDRDERAGRMEWSVRARAADGGYRWLTAQARAVRDEHGEIANWIVVFSCAEHEADERNTIASLAVSVPSMIWTTDSEGRTDWISPRWTEYTGLDGDALREGIVGVVHPQDYERVLAAWRAGASDGTAFEVEYRLRRHDGAYRWHLARAVAQRDDDGRIVRWIGTANDIDDQKRLYEREHHVADTLQRALLPGYLPDLPGLRLDAAYRPATVGLLVGGDYYDAFALADGSVCVSIGDVSGHGLSAAVTMGRVREAARIAAYAEGGRADIVLRRANRAALLAAPGELVTAVFGVIDPRTHRFSYACAGHPPPLVAAADGTVRVLECGGLPLGIDEDLRLALRTALLAPGDTLVLYTDGLIENDRNVIAGERRLLDALGEAARSNAVSASALVERIVPGAQRDDIAVLVVAVEARPLAEYDESFAAIGPSAGLARQALRRFLVVDGVAPERVEDALVAAGEAVANAIEHAYEHVAGSFRVRVASYADRVVVDVEDDGRWRTPRAGREPARPGEPSERGRGLFLMRAFTDGADLDQTPAGTRVRFVISRSV